MSVMRSISLYGLSDVHLTFQDTADDYLLAREVVFQRLSEVSYPTGVTPTLAPLAKSVGNLSIVTDSGVPDRTARN